MEGLEDQLNEEKAKCEEVKQLCTDLEREIESLKAQLVKEREKHDNILTKFDNLTRESATTLKDHNTKVKKLREHYKKELKATEKKDKSKKGKK